MYNYDFALEECITHSFVAVNNFRILFKNSIRFPNEYVSNRHSLTDNSVWSVYNRVATSCEEIGSFSLMCSGGKL